MRGELAAAAAASLRFCVAAHASLLLHTPMHSLSRTITQPMKEENAKMRGATSERGQGAEPRVHALRSPLTSRLSVESGSPSRTRIGAVSGGARADDGRQTARKACKERKTAGCNLRGNNHSPQQSVATSIASDSTRRDWSWPRRCVHHWPSLAPSHHATFAISAALSLVTSVSALVGV